MISDGVKELKKMGSKQIVLSEKEEVFFWQNDSAKKFSKRQKSTFRLGLSTLLFIVMIGPG